MEVKIEKTFQTKEPVEQVWKLLSDPPRVVVCVPGAKITEVVDDHTYKGAISVKVGPTVTDYRGEVRIEALDNAAHKIAMVGKGQDTRGKGSATMKMSGELKSLDGGGTEVVTISQVSVVGVLAQFGGRMIQEVSNKIFGEFVKSFQQELEKSVQAKDASGPSGGVAEGPPVAQSPSGAGPAAGAKGSEPSAAVSSSVATQPGEGPVRRQASLPAAEPKPINAISLMFSVTWSAIVNFFRRLFGRAEAS